ncbi:hypothetical protein DMH02_028820 [Streptomyces sp. WAC 00631]|uniref:hypothetical protein n=1 Tax=Streptomyces sp. WAC 00631 TaxID=2203201 RepID=UPI000F76679F|nr:hypothetical protein [Streptomyces sp. WAC 00631]MCC5037068.1 hypothetical protein [Streptomyces sp. WAC 00631]
MTSDGQGPGTPGDHPGRPSPPGPGEAREAETVRLPEGTPPEESRTGPGTGGSAPPGPVAGDDLTYSATVLDHAWGSVAPGPGPEPEPGGDRGPLRERERDRERDRSSGERTQVLPLTGTGAPPGPGEGAGRNPGPAHGSALPSGATASAGHGRSGPPYAPDGVLRFGPGVPARARWSDGGAAAGSAPHPPTPPPGSPPAGPWHGGPAPHRPPPARRGPRWPRRYAPAGLIMLCVVLFLAWDRSGPEFAVTGVTVRASGPGGCGTTVDVVARVRTNGQPGTIRYRWLRSDGTESGPLVERLVRGQREARLRLKWTFRGEGTVRATAELRITSPGRRTESAALTYRCG